MAAAFIIVARGVKGGIEKANLILMPALIVMAIAIAIFTLTLPGALDGAAYYLMPDLSKFSLSWSSARSGRCSTACRSPWAS